MPTRTEQKDRSAENKKFRTCWCTDQGGGYEMGGLPAGALIKEADMRCVADAPTLTYTARPAPLMLANADVMRA